jgi:hypothetical protein
MLYGTGYVADFVCLTYICCAQYGSLVRKIFCPHFSPSCTYVTYITEGCLTIQSLPVT